MFCAVIRMVALETQLIRDTSRPQHDFRSSLILNKQFADILARLFRWIIWIEAVPNQRQIFSLLLVVVLTALAT